MCGIEGLVYGRALELHSAAYAEQVRQMRSAVEEQIRADARQLPLRRQADQEFRQVGYEQQRALERAALARVALADWREANPVLAAGWDDWSRLVREEGWR